MPDPRMCECEHASHFDTASVEALSSDHPTHPYGAPLETTTVHTYRGRFEMCEGCKQSYLKAHKNDPRTGGVR